MQGSFFSELMQGSFFSELKTTEYPKKTSVLIFFF